jgi:hypothetical protein
MKRSDLLEIISNPLSTESQIADAKKALGSTPEADTDEGQITLVGTTDTKEEVEPLIVNRAVAKRLRAEANKILAFYPGGDPPQSLVDGWAARLGWIEMPIDSLTLRKTEAERQQFEMRDGIAVSPKKV